MANRIRDDTMYDMYDTYDMWRGSLHSLFRILLTKAGQSGAKLRIMLDHNVTLIQGSIKFFKDEELLLGLIIRFVLIRQRIPNLPIRTPKNLSLTFKYLNTRCYRWGIGTKDAIKKAGIIQIQSISATSTKDTWRHNL